LGTKLNPQQLSSVTLRRKGYIFGAGLILSCVLVAIELPVPRPTGSTSLPS
jgi:hypothetical protein